MRRHIFVGVAGVSLILLAVPLRAHHAFSAEFDADKPLKLEGTLVKTEWINPHAWLHIEVKKPDGKTEVWMIEGGTPNTLMRRGISRATLKIGAAIAATRGGDAKHRQPRVASNSQREREVGRSANLRSAPTAPAVPPFCRNTAFRPDASGHYP